MKNWKDVYELPLRKAKHGSWVYDNKSNFVFQFISQFDDKGNYAEGWVEFEQNVLECLNGKRSIPNIEFGHNINNIYINGQGEAACVNIILIRGWGNLTGVGGYNLPGDDAANIQYTFTQWIVETLNTK